MQSSGLFGSSRQESAKIFRQPACTLRWRRDGGFFFDYGRAGRFMYQKEKLNGKAGIEPFFFLDYRFGDVLVLLGRMARTSKTRGLSGRLGRSIFVSRPCRRQRTSGVSMVQHTLPAGKHGGR
jgi:hypothetical protein